MESFLTAMIAYFNSNAAASTLRGKLPGGLWLLEAPQGKTAGDYGILIPMGGSVEHHNDGHLEMPVIQISLFTITEDTSLALIEARDEFAKVFDNNLLTLANSPQGAQKHFQMRRDDYGEVVKEPEEGWAMHITYQVGIDQAAA